MEPTLSAARSDYPRIVFMGTPDFAVASLQALVEAGFTIAGVITAPDKPAGRGLKLSESAVKKYALEQGLPILQPPKLKDPDFLAHLRSLRADVQAVVAFRMLPELVWNMPPLGTINVHGSLLPQYRGAAPINWAVINGETETGVTTFLLQQAIDTGRILLSEKIPIGADETAGELHDRMKDAGARLLVASILGLVEGTLQGVPQPEVADEIQLRHAPKISTETGSIDWLQPAKRIHDLVRGLSPFPGAYTMLQDKIIKIYRSAYLVEPHDTPVGSSDTDGKTFLRFAAADGFLFAKEVQVEGKKRLPVTDFLRGYRF